MSNPLPAGVVKRIDASGDCWEWTGAISLDKAGDPRGHYQGQGSPRLVYRLLVGPIPRGLHLDHLCRNTLCVNPDHLEPVTRRENILRGYGPTAVNARKQRCIRGHAFDQENTYFTTDGRRQCRECVRAHMRAYRLRKKRAA